MAITFSTFYLGINTPSPTVLQCKERSLVVPFLNRVQHCLGFAFNLVDGVESATLQASFEFWEQEEVTGPSWGNRTDVEQ